MDLTLKTHKYQAATNSRAGCQNVCHTSRNEVSPDDKQQNDNKHMTECARCGRISREKETRDRCIMCTICLSCQRRLERGRQVDKQAGRYHDLHTMPEVSMSQRWPCLLCMTYKQMWSYRHTCISPSVFSAASASLCLSRSTSAASSTPSSAAASTGGSASLVLQTQAADRL